MSDATPLQYYRHRLTDDPRRLVVWFKDNWSTNGKLRVVSYVAGVAVVLLVLAWATLARNLPDAESLLDYETPLPTVVRGVDGEIVHSYARERRVHGLFECGGGAHVLTLRPCRSAPPCLGCSR